MTELAGQRSRRVGRRRRHHACAHASRRAGAALLRSPSGLIGLVLITILVDAGACSTCSGLLPYDPVAQDAPTASRAVAASTGSAPTSSAATSSPASPAASPTRCASPWWRWRLAAVVGTVAGLVAGFFGGVSDSR